MMRFKQYPNIIFLALGLFIMGNYFAFLFAEEKVTEAHYPQASKEECLKIFDINNVNFKDPKAIRNIPLLAEYFQCRAAVRDNINECNNLDPWPDRVETCRKYFNEYHGLFGRLLREGRITPQIFNTRKDFGSKEELELFMQGLLKGDISVCVKFSSNKQDVCKATISGDDRLCRDDPCRNKTTYIKAIKTENIKECDKIKNLTVKSMCLGYISMDEKICEKNKGFEEFRNKYCE